MNLDQVSMNPPMKIVNKRLSIAAGVDLPNKSLHDSDEAKHRRRHSRGLSKSLNISKIANKTTANTVSTNKTHQWSHDQLFTHYSQCMKLSLENKINQRNAFNLHLIDDMKLLINKDGKTNFAVAGGAIMAGAKIFSSRVDALETISNKLLLNLKIGAEDEDENNEDNIDELGDGKIKSKTRKRKRNCQVLETNTTSLRITSIPQVSLSNLIQKREGRSVDAANCSHLCTNQYKLCKDEVTINFVEETNDRLVPHDTSVQKMDTNENDDGRGCLFGSILSDIEELKNLERKKLSNGDEIEDYEFDSSSLVVEQPVEIQTEISNPFASKLDAAAIDGVASLQGSQGLGDISSCDDNMDFDDHLDQDVGFPTQQQDEVPFPSSKPAGEDEQAEVESATGSAPTCDLLNPDRLMAFQPSEFSFFKGDSPSSRNVENGYDAPENWLKMKSARANALRKTTNDNEMDKENSENMQTKKKGEPPSKKRKSAAKAGVDLTLAKVEAPKSRTNLQKITKAKKDAARDNRKNQLTIKKSHISKAELIKALQTSVYIKPLESSVLDQAYLDMDNDINEDDLTTAINHINHDFCPPVAADYDDGDDHHEDDDHDEGLVFDPTTNNDADEKRDDYDLDSSLSGEVPKRRGAIPKFNLKNINKKVDVKKLKEVIWKDLREKNDDRKKLRDESIISEAGDNEQSIQEDNNEEPVKFMQTITSLSSKLHGNLRENLSLPIAFACLLHLANEKELKIESVPTYDDLVITLPDKLQEREEQIIRNNFFNKKK